MQFVRQLLGFVKSDVRLELRTLETILSALFLGFAVFVLGAAVFQIDGMDARLMASGTLWVSVFVAVNFAIPRVWQRERDEGALQALLLTGVAANALYWGKVFATWCYLLLVTFLFLPLVSLVFGVATHALMTASFLLLVALTLLGVACAGTLFGSMTIRTRGRDTMLAVILLPLLLPVLLTAASATRQLFVPSLEDAHVGINLWPWLRVVGAYDLIVGALASLFFADLMEE